MSPALAVASAVLVLLTVLGIVLIPILDQALQRTAARCPANDNMPAAQPESPHEAHHG